jgi:hypothetical protein
LFSYYLNGGAGELPSVLLHTIKLIVIPGGLTPYLKAGDIGIYHEFKDKISNLINDWKNSDGVENTIGSNPRPPTNEVIQTWILEAWIGKNNSNIENSIKVAGFNENSFRGTYTSMM